MIGNTRIPMRTKPPLGRTVLKVGIDGIDRDGESEWSVRVTPFEVSVDVLTEIGD